MKIFLSVFLLFLFSALYAQPKPGELAPEIQLPDVHGKQVSLQSLKGNIVLVDFWASWCGPCRKSNKELAALYNRYHAKGFEIYGISIDERTADWQKAIAADHILWLQVNEPGGWNAPVSSAWKIEQIPTSFLLDANGRVVAVDPDKSFLSSYLRKQLKP